MKEVIELGNLNIKERKERVYLDTVRNENSRTKLDMMNVKVIFHSFAPS